MPGFCQRTYEKGYVVFAKQDTVQGFIDYKNWEYSPSEIAFKTSLDQEAKIYTAYDVATFFIEKNRELYDAHQLSYIPIYPDIVYRQLPYNRVLKNLFLQRLWSNGTVFLYNANISEGHKDRFWVKKNGVMTELVHYTFRRQYNNVVYEANISEYEQQLKELTKDATHFSGKKPSYTSQSLVQYLHEYNEALDGTKEYTPVKDKYDWYIGLSGSLETFNFDENSKGNNPTCGTSVRVNLPRNFNNAFIKASYHITTGLSVWNYDKKMYENELLKAFEFSAGYYLGHSSVQPFYSLGLGMYKLKYDVGGVFFPSVGVSYKKKIELEVTRFMDFMSLLGIADKHLLVPPRISLSYHFKL